MRPKFCVGLPGRFMNDQNYKKMSPKILKIHENNCKSAKFLFLLNRTKNAERLSNYKKLVNFTSAKGMVFWSVSLLGGIIDSTWSTLLSICQSAVAFIKYDVDILYDVRYFSKGFFPSGNFSNDNFPTEHFSKRQLPRYVLVAAPQKAEPNFWKIAA